MLAMIYAFAYSQYMAKDFLDELIAESSAQDPAFADKVEAAFDRRVFARALAEKRKALNLSQQIVADRMRSTQPVVSKIENGGDVQISTLERYATAIDCRLELKVSD